MKKFYTVLSAIACGAFMSVSAGSTLPSLSASNLQEPKNVEYTTQLKAEDLSISSMGRPARVAARAAQATTADFVDELFLSESYGLSSGHKGWRTDGLAGFESAGGNAVKVYGFLGFDCAFDATFSPEKSTLSIPTKQKFEYEFSTGVQSVTLLMVDATTNPYTIVDDDIVMEYDADSKCFFWVGESNSSSWTKVLAFCRSSLLEDNVFTGAYDFLASIEMNAVNNIMTYYDGELESQSGCYVYADKTAEGLSVRGLFGFGFQSPTLFTLDEAARTATATDQILGYSKQTPFYLMVAEDGGDNSIVGNSTVVFNASKVTFTDENNQPVSEGYVLASGEKDVVVVAPKTMSDLAFFGSAVSIQLEGMDLFGNAGINGVEVEDVENAPVEYYNLQGMKVANPENGLYIRRQGSRIEKILVK